VLVQQNRVAFNHRFDGRFITAFHPLSILFLSRAAFPFQLGLTLGDQ